MQKRTESELDLQEIAKFEQQASSWWDENGPLRTLHQINPLRMEFINKHIDLTNRKVLDVGCGGGILSESLAKAEAQVTAIDMANNVIKIAKMHAKLQNLNIDYQSISIEDFSEQNYQKFDVITCMELLEHVPNPQKFMQTMLQCLAPNGYLFISTLNRNFKAYLGAIVAAEYILKLLPVGTHEYDKFIQPNELCSWCRQNNLITKDLAGIEYNLWQQNFYLSNNIDINYLVCAVYEK